MVIGVLDPLMSSSSVCVLCSGSGFPGGGWHGDRSPGPLDVLILCVCCVQEVGFLEEVGMVIGVLDPLMSSSCVCVVFKKWVSWMRLAW